MFPPTINRDSQNLLEEIRNFKKSNRPQRCVQLDNLFKPTIANTLNSP